MAAVGTGRDAFRHLSPPGFRIRLMEPGEAEALRAICAVSGLFGDGRPDIADFVRWLLLHEVFVAESETGGPVGFAAARDATDLYWLSGLAVDPAFKGRGVRKALLSAVCARAGWFFHRAVGLAVRDGTEADWYRRRRFLRIGRTDWTEALSRLADESPGFPPGVAVPSFSTRSEPDEGAALVGTERTLMIHWL